MPLQIINGFTLIQMFTRAIKCDASAKRVQDATKCLLLRMSLVRLIHTRANMWPFVAGQLKSCVLDLSLGDFNHPKKSCCSLSMGKLI